MIISFIGNDGSGKSTLIKKVKEELENNKYNVIVLEEFQTPLLRLIKKLRKASHSEENIPNNFSLGHTYFTLQFIDNLLQILFYKIFFQKSIILKDRYKEDFIATMIELHKYNLFEKVIYSLLPKSNLTFKIDVDPKVSWIRRGKIKKLNFYKDKKTIYDDILNKKENIIYIDNQKNLQDGVTKILESISLKKKLAQIGSIKISGIDGAGKSTTIETIESNLKQLNVTYVKTHFYYNYIPIKILKMIRIIFKIKEKSTDDHNLASIENEKKSKNKDRSVIWKIYVLLDASIQFLYINIIGYNKIKIYDRYFLDYKISWDFLGVTYPEKVFSFLGKFNENYFILGADAETLYKRKPEHTKEFFKETVTSYKRLAKRFNIIMIDTKKNNSKEVTKYILKEIN